MNREIYLTFAYMTTDQEEQYVEDCVRNILAKIPLDTYTDIQKIAVIHDYICSSVDYDYAAEEVFVRESHSAYGALHNGKAVCQGYVSLFYYMCKAAGIPIRIITGENHAWNILKYQKKVSESRYRTREGATANGVKFLENNRFNEYKLKIGSERAII